MEMLLNFSFPKIYFDIFTKALPSLFMAYKGYLYQHISEMEYPLKNQVHWDSQTLFKYLSQMIRNIKILI